MELVLRKLQLKLNLKYRKDLDNEYLIYANINKLKHETKYCYCLCKQEKKIWADRYICNWISIKI